ncbi:MAG TPA: cytochrome c1, partial [Methyloceanibacter sp.]|nr:cytochrome c1 [Methyloceanibacter sp.]
MISRLSAVAALLVAAVPAAAQDAHAPKIDAQHWSFAPPFGSFDNAQLQRGFQVYKDVCAQCHS